MNGVIIAAIICGTVIILSLIENRKSSYKRKYDVLVAEMEKKEDVYNQFLKLALPGSVIKFVNWGNVGYCLTTECLYRFQGEKMIVYNRDDIVLLKLTITILLLELPHMQNRKWNVILFTN